MVDGWRLTSFYHWQTDRQHTMRAITGGYVLCAGTSAAVAESDCPSPFHHWQRSDMRGRIAEARWWRGAAGRQAEFRHEFVLKVLEEGKDGGAPCGLVLVRLLGPFTAR